MVITNFDTTKIFNICIAIGENESTTRCLQQTLEQQKENIVDLLKYYQTKHKSSRK